MKLTTVIEDTTITVQGTLGSVRAQLFRGDPAYNRIFVHNASSTGDIESQRVVGVHGPEFVHVILVG